MTADRKHYPADHWLKSADVEKALKAYLDQQSKVYSRIKNSYVQDLAGDLRGKRVLDYGCGGGMFVVSAALAGASEVWAVDAEKTVLDTARHFAQIKDVEPSCRFVVSPCFPALPSSIRFDVIVMKDVLEHVPDDRGLLEAAAGSLVPGGKLVVSTQNALSLNYLLEGGYEKLVLGNRAWCGWDSTHLRFYTPMNLANKLHNAGFVCDLWRSVYIVPYKFRLPRGAKKQFLRVDGLGWIDRLLGRVFPYNRLGWNIMVRACTRHCATGPSEK
jgi:2-polyprenyl-6-hydroxyphenyl methylase / 3-demethylubiquinone-9 3-methyltransferase